MAFQDIFNNLLETALKENASDLHITVGRYPTLRVDGGLIPLLKEPLITPEFAEEFVDGFLSSEDKKRFKEEKELDFSYSFQERARFRVNVFHQRGYAAAALRYIPTHIRDFTELNLPEDTFARILHRNQGFILVVGPTGQGKTTTLAAMIDYINKNYQWNIVTVEDPIEYLFTSDRSSINQREVGSDTNSFARAMRSMFREDVNAVMIGEMRDPETIATALTAAETGHLIFSSLHTNNASQTIDRIIDAFPGSQQTQVRAQLAGSLVAIVSQRLITRLQGGLIPAIEIMIANNAIRNLIRENKTYEIDLMIEMESQEGMVSLNRSLASLVKKGEISMESAMSYSLNPAELKSLIR
ncbi:MAG: PilT/PilU family type 4a pilus ATPase [Patescibacteria group bacterium]